MQKGLIVVGVFLVLLGVAWPYLGQLGLGRLPGDIAIERDHFRFYFPIVTCAVISVIVSIVLWFMSR